MSRSRRDRVARRPPRYRWRGCIYGCSRAKAQPSQREQPVRKQNPSGLRAGSGGLSGWASFWLAMLNMKPGGWVPKAGRRPCRRNNQMPTKYRVYLTSYGNLSNCHQQVWTGSCRVGAGRNGLTERVDGTGTEPEGPWPFEPENDRRGPPRCSAATFVDVDVIRQHRTRRGKIGGCRGETKMPMGQLGQPPSGRGPGWGMGPLPPFKRPSARRERGG
ncbi:hypothetical protein B0T18DRAFT_129738 [Schizothecium vesticola]|uniref:Uncharacterized protein n=1 Tax=Schizothecium vesticola TaxID=314040 RepID=A0AA40F409_9PEZI|nr:hypothetical protein B0T18DRAFT_129738 [Schizothecium vesticola]